MRRVHRIAIVITVVVLLGGCGGAGAGDLGPPSSSGKADETRGDPATGLKVHGDLIVVHPSRTWDPLTVAAPAITQLLESWINGEHQVHVLRHDDIKLFHPPGSDRQWFYLNGSWVYSSSPEGGMSYPEEVDSYYVTERPGVVFVESEDGEHAIDPTTSEITFVGGYLNRCLAHAVGWSIKQHLESAEPSALRIRIYLPGVFAFTDRVQEDLPDDIRDIWPYPVNPGFVRLHQQVGILDSCPSMSDVENEMIDTRDEPMEFGGAPMPEDLTLSFSCDGAGIGELGQGSSEPVSIDFISR